MGASEHEGSRLLKSDAHAAPLWRQIAATALPVLMLVALWHKRGAAVGIVAFLFYAGVMIGATFRPDRVAAWSRRHVVLDALVILPLAFLALAYLTTWSLAACALVAMAAGAVVVPLAVRRPS